MKKLFGRKLCNIYKCSKCENEFVGIVNLCNHFNEKHNENYK